MADKHPRPVRWVSTCESCGYPRGATSTTDICSECGYHSKYYGYVFIQAARIDLKQIGFWLQISLFGLSSLGIASFAIFTMRRDGPLWVVVTTLFVVVAAAVAIVTSIKRLQQVVYSIEQATLRATGMPWTSQMVLWCSLLVFAWSIECVFAATAPGVGSDGLIFTDVLLVASLFGVLKTQADVLYEISSRYQQLRWQAATRQCKSFVRHGWWASGLLWILMMNWCVIGFGVIAWYAVGLVWVIVAHVAASDQARRASFLISNT